MLKENQLEAIDYLIAGTKTKEEIAKCVGIAPRTLYRWIENQEFKVELQKRTEAFQSNLKKEAQSRMSSKLGMAIENIIELANNSASDKIKLDANVFIYESLLGKATTKIQDVTEESKEDTAPDINSMLLELDSEESDAGKDNVIDLEKKKAK